MREPLSLFDAVFKPIADFFYELRHKNVRFKQTRNILTMSGETLLPYQIMKVGEEFYLERASLDKVERILPRISDRLNGNFVAIQDGELVRIIRVK
jgi:hypothetical protein